MECFDEDDKLAADILIQLSEQVPEHGQGTGFVPTWGSKALRSVLVNIPPPYKSSPPIVMRPGGNAVPRVPESLPSSLNPRPAPARLRLKIKSPGAKLMRTDVPLGEATSHLVEEAVDCGRHLSECRMGMDGSKETGPLPLPNGFLIPKETFVIGGATSHLVEEAVKCGREELECRMGMDGSKETRALPLPQPNGCLIPNKTFVMGGATAHLVEEAVNCGRGELECRMGMDGSKETRALPLPHPNGCLIPNETLMMRYFIQSFQFNKQAVYAEARKKRKLHMDLTKKSKRPCL